MKTIPTIGIIALTIGLVILWGCSKKEAHPTSIYISYYADRTTPESPLIDTALVQNQFGFEQNLWNGATFALATIGDVSITPTYHITLPPENEWYSNKLIRIAAVKEFLNGIGSAITEVNQSSAGKSHSLIYTKISSGLADLAKSDADIKRFIIQSDLREYTPSGTNLTDFYNTNTIQLLKTHPERIQAEFEKQAPLSDLSGIDVIILYEPKDYVDGLVFDAIIKIYKTLLETKNVKSFTVGTSLQTI